MLVLAALWLTIGVVGCAILAVVVIRGDHIRWKTDSGVQQFIAGVDLITGMKCARDCDSFHSKNMTEK